MNQGIPRFSISLKQPFLLVLSGSAEIISSVPFLKCREKKARPDAAFPTPKEMAYWTTLVASARPDWGDRTGTFREYYPWTKSESMKEVSQAQCWGGPSSWGLENSGAEVWGREKAKESLDLRCVCQLWKMKNWCWCLLCNPLTQEAEPGGLPQGRKEEEQKEREKGAACLPLG